MVRSSGVREALYEHARTPAVTTLLHRTEVEVAELLTEMIPSAELVVFGKNGADACTAAARVARAATGRKVILSNGFHGMHDWFIAALGPSEGVIPGAGYLKPFPFNDVAALEALANAHADDLAAIMIEPAYRELPQPGYLQAVRRIADRHGALLIFDEIITAFRVHRGGAQAVYGVTPDLTCVGKALANGLPLSALLGRRDVMQFVNRVFYALTFQHDSVALAVSRACLRYYRDHDVAGTVTRKGEILRRLYDEAPAAAGLPGRGVGLPGRLDIAGPAGCRPLTTSASSSRVACSAACCRAGHACEALATTISSGQRAFRRRRARSLPGPRDRTVRFLAPELIPSRPPPLPRPVARRKRRAPFRPGGRKGARATDSINRELCAGSLAATQRARRHVLGAGRVTGNVVRIARRD
jgi:acetylornithine/succinyldiaminopimelate/putrescine aminotransferase